MLNNIDFKQMISRGLLPLMGLGCLSFWDVQPAAASGETSVSAELMLSVDISGSVNTDEYNLQMDGYADAFRDEDVIDAIEALPDGLAISLQFWAGKPAPDIGWRVLRTRGDIISFANELDHLPRPSSNTQSVAPWSGSIGWSTGIANGLQAATTSILENSYDGEILIIDISGDGTENVSRNIVSRTWIQRSWGGYYRNNYGYEPIENARDNAVSNGITVNGLPIDPYSSQSITNHYNDYVIGGTDAFAEVSTGFDDFTRAVKTKLQREITNAYEQLDYCNVSSNITNDAGITVTIEDAGVQGALATGNKYVVDFNSSSLASDGFSLSNAGTTYTYEGNYELANADVYGGANGSRHIRSVVTNNDSSCFRVRLDRDQKYFGFWWSAGDSYNKLTFRNNGQEVGVFVTEDLKNFIDNSNSINTSDYYGNPNTGGNSGEPYSFVNVFFDDGVSFDEVIFETTTNDGAKFESDNHTFSTTSEPRGERVTNEPPVAMDDSDEVEVTRTITINVLANDSDPDLDLNTDSWTTEAITITQIEGTDVSAGTEVSVNGGTAKINQNGEIVYTAGNIPGTFTFDYTISDLHSATNTGTVTIKVTPFSD